MLWLTLSTALSKSMIVCVCCLCAMLWRSSSVNSKCWVSQDPFSEIIAADCSVYCYYQDYSSQYLLRRASVPCSTHLWETGLVCGIVVFTLLDNWCDISFLPVFWQQLCAPDDLNITVKQGVISSASSFKNCGLMPSRPAACVMSRLYRSFVHLVR